MCAVCIPAHLDEAIAAHTLSLSLHEALKRQLGPLVAFVPVHGVVAAGERCQLAVALRGQVGLQPGYVLHCGCISVYRVQSESSISVQSQPTALRHHSYYHITSMVWSYHVTLLVIPGDIIDHVRGHVTHQSSSHCTMCIRTVHVYMYLH